MSEDPVLGADQAALAGTARPTGAKLAQQLGIPPEALWEKIPGVTDQDIRRWKEMRSDSAGNRSPTWAFMQKFEIPDYDHPERNYLTRWRLIQTPWFGIYVHRMDGPDPRATLHDHPWPFLSIILRGGYTEQRRYGSSGVVVLPDVYGENVVRIRRFNAKRATDLHFIRHLHRTPTWTLMLVGRRRRTWGYVDPDGTWTAFDEHRHNDEFEAATAWRAMRNTETLTGTLTIASPKRGTLPPASLTPVAKRLPCTFIVTDTPLKSNGKSLGFWIRSLTSIRNSSPSP